MFKYLKKEDVIGGAMILATAYCTCVFLFAVTG